MIALAFLLACAWAGPALALAWYARSEGEARWPVLGALRAPRAGAPDLRFASFVAALAALVLSMLAGRPAGWSIWAVLALSAVLVPALVLAEAALADLFLRVLPGTWETARLAASLSTGQLARPAVQRALVEQAHCEVAAARTIVEDPSLLAALDTLEEAVGDYARAIERVDDSETLRGLRARLRGVTALTRSCLDDYAEDLETPPPVEHPASDEEVARVCQQLEQATQAA